MKLLLQEVECCEGCYACFDYPDRDGTTSFFCMHEDIDGKLIMKEYLDRFPGWCPLEDAPTNGDIDEEEV